eukprot:2703809-Amphidinium_carterae.1
MLVTDSSICPFPGMPSVGAEPCKELKTQQLRPRCCISQMEFPKMLKVQSRVQDSKLMELLGGCWHTRICVALPFNVFGLELALKNIC